MSILKKISKLIVIVFLLLTIIVVNKKTEAKIKTIIYNENKIQTKNNDTFLNEISTKLVNIHTAIGYKRNLNIEDTTILGTISNLQKLNDVDILDALSLSSDKKTTLTDYLSELEKTLNISDTITNNLTQEINFIKADIDTYGQQKIATDRDYYTSIQNNDEITSKIALSNSIELSKLIAENRVKYNANKGLLDKLQYYNLILTKKYNYLDSKREIILEHFDLIKDNILQDITNTKETIEYYKY